MRLSQLLPQITDRATLVGMTGCGKTVLTRYLVMPRKHVIVLDVKGRIKWPDFTVYRELDALVDVPGRIIYKPSIEDSQDEDEMNRFFEYIYRRGNTTVVVDELASIVRRQTLPSFYHACLTRGRELGISVIQSTQYPTFIPSMTLSESEHFYIFHLSLPDHRKKVSGITGIDEDKIAVLPKRYFIYSDLFTQTRPKKLKL